MTVAYRAPAFIAPQKEQAAQSMALSLRFGRTSPLYKRLVQDEQKVDQLFDSPPNRVDPALATIGARIKNPAIGKHLSSKKLSVVIIARDATGLKQALVSDAFSPIKYDASQPHALLDQDKQIGAMKPDIKPESVRITPAADVFAQ